MKNIALACLVAIAISALVGLAGCASFGEIPTDHVAARLHWYIDAPDFRAERIEWNHVHGADKYARIGRLCGDDNFMSHSCALRIREGGQCVVFSLHSERAAHYALDGSGESVRQHELRHCGVGMPHAAGWRHREAVVL